MWIGEWLEDTYLWMCLPKVRVLKLSVTQDCLVILSQMCMCCSLVTVGWEYYTRGKMVYSTDRLKMHRTVRRCCLSAIEPKCIHTQCIWRWTVLESVSECRETKSGYTPLKRRKMDIQSCSKKNSLESHTHWMLLWSATMENARVKASSSSKVCPRT